MIIADCYEALSFLCGRIERQSFYFSSFISISSYRVNWKYIKHTINPLYSNGKWKDFPIRVNYSDQRIWSPTPSRLNSQIKCSWIWTAGTVSPHQQSIKNRTEWNLNSRIFVFCFCVSLGMSHNHIGYLGCVWIRQYSFYDRKRLIFTKQSNNNQ